MSEHQQLGLALAVQRDEIEQISTWLAEQHLPADHPAVRLGTACASGCSDWADTAWKPVDAVLRSRFFSGLFAAVPTVAVAVVVLRAKGTVTVFTSFGSIFGVGAALAGAVRAGRKYRDVEPPEPKARRRQEVEPDEAGRPVPRLFPAVTFAQVRRVSGVW